MSDAWTPALAPELTQDSRAPTPWHERDLQPSDWPRVYEQHLAADEAGHPVSMRSTVGAVFGVMASRVRWDIVALVTASFALGWWLGMPVS